MHSPYRGWIPQLVLVAACAAPATAQEPSGLTWGRAELFRTGTIERRGLTESSALVRSVTEPGVFWTIEDSGNSATLHAMDSTGRELGRVRVTGAENHDWEALAMGPCGAEQCIHIGDVGDNLGLRGRRTVYRVRDADAIAQIGRQDGEPGTAQAPGRVSAERLDFRYETGRYDVEAMVVSNDGAIHLITKGRRGGILHLRIAAGPWDNAGTALATRMDSLPIPPVTASDRVTDAALAPDGTLAVRTRRTLYLFRMDPTSGKLASTAPELACDLTGANEPQGEAVAWMGSDRWLLTSEERGSPITQVRCRRPAVSPRP